MTVEERENVIFIIHSHSGINLEYLNSLTDEALKRLYKDRINGKV